jgi:predicted transcriptional regulator
MLVVPQDSFQVCIQKFQHEIDVLLHGVHVEQLAHRISWAIPKRS